MSLLKTLIDNPGRKRVEALSKLERLINSVKRLFPGEKACPLSLATNTVDPGTVGISFFQITHIPMIEEHLTMLRNDGCSDLFILLSTLGGEITFPETLISKAKNMGFSTVNTIVADMALSAGTLLALLSDRILGFSHSILGPVDPQMVVSTSFGPRVVSATQYKEFIERVLPRLAREQNMGVENLARLYAAQDLYLYQRCLKSLEYVRRLLANMFDRDVYSKLEKILLTEAEEHSKPIPLKDLEGILVGKVVLVDAVAFESVREIMNTIDEYNGLRRHLFLFERAAPNMVPVFLVASKHGELVQQATVAYPPPQQPQTRQL